MNKIEYLMKLNELDLDKNCYCIIASGAMLMHGLCDNCADIDIRVTEELFKKLNERYNMKQSPRYDYVFELSKDVDVNCKNFNHNDIEFIDGYPVEKLEINLAWMLKNNRPKDQDKIRIIKDYLKL